MLFNCQIIGSTLGLMGFLKGGTKIPRAVTAHLVLVQINRRETTLCTSGD